MNLNVANEKLDRSDVLTLQVAEASTLQLSLEEKTRIYALKQRWNGRNDDTSGPWA